MKNLLIALAFLFIGSVGFANTCVHTLDNKHNEVNESNIFANQNKPHLNLTHSILTPCSTFVNVYINGEYAGYYVVYHVTAGCSGSDNVRLTIKIDPISA